MWKERCQVAVRTKLDPETAEALTRHFLREREEQAAKLADRSDRSAASADAKR
jgi:hypothetical protein